LAGLVDSPATLPRRSLPTRGGARPQHRWLVGGVLALAAAGVGAWPASQTGRSAGAVGLNATVMTARPSSVAAMPPRSIQRAPSLATRPPGTAQPARLAVSLQHNLKAARLRIWGDDDLLLDERLSGTERRRLALFKTTAGALARRLEVLPATRMLRMEVSWAGGSREASVPLKLHPGAKRRLDAEVQGRSRTLSLRLL
jgi:hypothetical protein